eukprot:6450147-Karenia_brevis.AAC.1
MHDGIVKGQKLKDVLNHGVITGLRELPGNWQRGFSPTWHTFSQVTVFDAGGDGNVACPPDEIFMHVKILT